MTRRLYERWELPPRQRRRAQLFDMLLLAMVIAGAILLCSQAWSDEARVVPEPSVITSDKNSELVIKVSNAIVLAITDENWSWYECGQVTPKDQYEERATRIVEALHNALKSVGLSHPNYLWAATGIIWQESHGNPCPIGPNSRKWAVSKKLIREKNPVYWTAEDTLGVFQGWQQSKRKTGLDAGLGQTIWPFNAKILEPDGTVRTALPEEMVTVEGSARTVAYHLLENAQIDPRRPWAYWPGLPKEEYAKKIEQWVRYYGGPKLSGPSAWRDGKPADVGSRQYTRR